MSALPDPTFNTRLNERAYHPSMRAAVVAAYESGVVVRVFPALIRIEDLADAVAWLKDLSGVKVESCTTCARMGIPCILHNGSSYRCLYCFLKNGDACSHQTEMQRMGYKATPPCFPYIEAIHHGLIAVPEGMLWSGKKNQTADFIQRVLAPAGARAGPAPPHPQGSARSDHKPAVQPASATNPQQRQSQAGPSAAQGGVSNEQLLGLFDHRLDAVEGRLSTLQNGLQEIMNELRRGHSSLSLTPPDERVAAPAPINEAAVSGQMDRPIWGLTAYELRALPCALSGERTQAWVADQARRQ